MKQHTVGIDVLVVGGGMAGCFAAIKAKEQGVAVALVDKGYVGKSGQTPFAGNYAVFNPAWSHNLDAWMRQVNILGEYVNNRVWTETVFRESYARHRDLLSWGAAFSRDKKGSFHRSSHPIGVSEALDLIPTFAQSLRRQVVKMGVTILDRVMITDLVKQDGRVVGAVGFPSDSLDLYIFEAKATVICAGAGGFKPSGWPIRNLTADGHAMAYRVGASITGKEFLDTHSTRADHPAAKGGMFMGAGWSAPIGQGPPKMRLVNAEGNEVPGLGTLFLEMEFEAHAGRAPLLRGKTPMVGGATSGMSVHTTEGIWPVNTQCVSSVPGLYAAGDSLGTMMVGALYSGFGFALTTASVTGARAGWGAAEYALQVEKPTMDEAEIARVKTRLRAPLDRKGGFSSRWVTQVLQNLMFPYFVMYIKHGDRLQATLALVEFLKDHLVPKMFATDSHELRLVHETRNMVLNAEMRLRASLFRTESRGTHYREDYPRRVDPDWLAWVLLREEDGLMKIFRKPIPEAWYPDLSKPYEELYPIRFPGE